jgi:hypothetical protein
MRERWSVRKVLLAVGAAALVAGLAASPASAGNFTAGYVYGYEATEIWQQAIGSYYYYPETDPTLSGTMDWGDGSATQSLIFSPAGFFNDYVVAGPHTYAEEGTYSATVKITDNGTTTSYPLSIPVYDVPVTVTPVAASGSEGVALNALVATFTDPADPGATAADYTATIDWGDDTTSAATVAANDGGGFKISGSHTYAEGAHYYSGAPGRTPYVYVSDVVGGVIGFAALDVTIADLPLTVTAGTVDVNQGDPFSGTVATFTDADPDGTVSKFAAEIDWGDGATAAGAIAAEGGGFKVTGTHTYSKSGSPTVKVTVDDLYGDDYGTISGTASTSFTATVHDVTAPTITLTTPPDGARYADDAVVYADYSCSDESGGSGLDTCAGTVPDGAQIDTATRGTKTFTVTATDLAGNPSTVSHDYYVGDVTPPTISCDGPTPRWHRANVSVACTAYDDDSGLADPDDGSFSLFTSVPDGTETADAATSTHEVCDNAGNCATAGPIAGNKVDRKAPSAAMGALPRLQRATVFPVAWSGSDGGSGLATFDVRYRAGSTSSDFGGWTLWQSKTAATAADFTGSPSSDYCFSVRARDAVGNVSSWNGHECSAVPVDDPSLAATGSWSREAGQAGYYLKTFSLSTAAGDTLGVSDVRAKRMAVLATRCPTCGSITVSWNGVVSPPISLAASSVEKKRYVWSQVLPFAQFGDLVITVAPSGGRVEIDGAAFGQR